VRALPLLLQKPTNCNFFYEGQKYATIAVKALAIFVLVGTTVSRPHIIGAPVYIIHCESNVSEHGSGSGHPAGVGHGGGEVKKSS